MKLKKCMALGLAAVMTASFVLGCGGGSGDETQAPAGDGASAASDASGMHRQMAEAVICPNISIPKITIH